MTFLSYAIIVQAKNPSAASSNTHIAYPNISTLTHNINLK